MKNKDTLCPTTAAEWNRMASELSSLTEFYRRLHPKWPEERIIKAAGKEEMKRRRARWEAVLSKYSIHTPNVEEWCTVKSELVSLYEFHRRLHPKWAEERIIKAAEKDLRTLTNPDYIEILVPFASLARECGMLPRNRERRLNHPLK